MLISLVSIYINHRNTYDTHKIYDVVFFGDPIHTTVTHDPATVTEWISDIESLHCSRLNCLIVGLDVEWRPSFTHHQQNPVAILQLCIGKRCLIYQIFHARHIPQALIDFLDEVNYTFVGIGVISDLNKLDKDYGIGSDSKAVELGKLAASVHDRRELMNVGLKDLTRFVLGKRMEKPRRVTMSRWDQRRLTEDQVKYACVDAYVSFEIGRVLNASEY